MEASKHSAAAADRRTLLTATLIANDFDVILLEPSQLGASNAHTRVGQFILSINISLYIGNGTI